MKKVILALSTISLMVTLASCPNPKKGATDESELSKVEEKVQEAGDAIANAAETTTDTVKSTLSEGIDKMKEIFNDIPKLENEKAREFVMQYTQYVNDVKDAAASKNIEKIAQLKEKAADWTKKAKEIAATLKPQEAKSFNEYVNKLNEYLAK